MTDKIRTIKINKEEAEELLAADRANYDKRKGKTWGVAARSNVVVPGGEYSNPVVKCIFEK